MKNLSKFSIENLKRIQKVLKILLDELELHKINRLTGNKIPIEKFEKEELSRDDVLAVFNRINEKDNLIRLIEESFDFTNLEFYPPKTELEKIEFSAQKQAESERYISFIVINLEELKKIKEDVDKKLKKEDYIQPVKIFTNEIIPDRITDTEIEKQMREAQIRQSERMERERLHQEQMKQDRILRTPVDKYTHALDLIIERAEYTEDGNSFSIEFYDFNFERMIGSKMLEKFLTEIQKDGCFEKYTRTNYAGGTRFGFIKPSVEKLKAFKEKRGKIKEEKILKKDFKGHGEIKKITIIKMNDGKYLFAINDDYGSAKKISSYSEWWQIFIKEIAERNMRPETRTNVKEIPKDMADYFNYNIDKCPIYMGGKYDLTNIFVGKGIDTMINPDIKTEIISEKKYLIRKKKKNKK